METTSRSHPVDRSAATAFSNRSGFRRSSRRLLTLAFAATIAGGLGLGHAEPAGAASIGQYSLAAVQCNWRYHTMTLTAAASPAPGYASQTVYFKYWLFDVTLNSWVPGYSPTQWGSLNAWTSTKNALGYTVINTGTTSSVPWTFPVNAHKYTVSVQYAWLVGGSWLYSQPAISQNYEEQGYAFDVGNGFIRHDYCVA
jgi:hypothetical protein